MPLFSDDDDRPTGDIFSDYRKRAANPTVSSAAGLTHPRPGAMVPQPPRQLSTSTGTLYTDRAAQSTIDPRVFSRDTTGIDLSTGATRKYVGAVNIGTGDNRRTYGFRTTRQFNRAQRAVSERNRRVAKIRADAARRGISLKEAQDMNNNQRGLSLGQKILNKAGTQIETKANFDPKPPTPPMANPKNKRFAADNAIPRAQQRAQRMMVPPGVYGKKELSFGQRIVADSKAQVDLEQGEKRSVYESYPKTKIEKAYTRSETVGGAVGGGILGGALGMMPRAASKKVRAAWMAGGAGLGSLFEGSRARRNARRDITTFRELSGKSKDEPESFGQLVIEQARAKLE